MTAKTIAPFLDNLIVGKAVSYQGLTVFPLCVVHGDFDAQSADVATLGQGIAEGWLRAEETGAMERVRLRNLGTARALALDGETLIGAAQNRMLNTSAVLPPGRDCELESCCVEVNRWEPKKKGAGEEERLFTGSGLAHGSLRRLKMEQAEHSLMSDRVARVDQKEVWRNIVRQFGISGASTKTLDIHDLYEFWSPALRVYEQRFYMQKGQKGMVSFLDPDTWFIDVFLNYDMMAAYFRPLVRSYAFDDLIRLESGPHPGAPQARPAAAHAQSRLLGIKTARCHPYPSPESNTVFFFTPNATGTAVLEGGSLLHLTTCSKSIE